MGEHEKRTSLGCDSCAIGFKIETKKQRITYTTESLDTLINKLIERALVGILALASGTTTTTLVGSQEVCDLKIRE